MTTGYGNNRNVFWWLLFAIVTFVCVMGMVGCKTPCPCAALPSGGTHDHTGDSVRTEYVHDSITIDRWHTRYVKGDTVYVRDSIFRERWRNKHDSIYINNTDTIRDTVTVEVEKKGSAFLRNSGIALWVLIALFVIAAIIGIVLKFAK